MSSTTDLALDEVSSIDLSGDLVTKRAAALLGLVLLIAVAPLAAQQFPVWEWLLHNVGAIDEDGQPHADVIERRAATG
jgi:hypothetical protein